MMQNLDRLKPFYHVYSSQSVLAASKALNVSQSAVSQSIQKLESEIKTPLFTRVNKRLVPTVAGESLFTVVAPFFNDLEGCLNSIHQSKKQPFGEIRIGLPEEFGKTFFPELVAQFRKIYPDVTFYLIFGGPATLLPMVENGQVDFAIVDVFLTRKQFFANLDIFHFETVAEEEVVLACSNVYYEESIKKDHSFETLIKQNFITYRHDARSVKNWFMHHFDKHPGDPRVVLVVDNHQAVVSAIRNHIGIAVISSYPVKEDMEQGRIIHVDTSKPRIINRMALAVLQDKVPTTSEKVFQKFMMDRLRSIRL